MEEDPNSEAQAEGYLLKRTHAGVIGKSMKRRWYVLKDGELRSYQSEDICKKNAEMFQDVLPVSRIQTVRNANENHGVEVVTQQKKFILVASSEEDQKKWIKAIYEALKDNRPRSASCPPEKTSPTRKISASKFLPRMFTFNRKSLDETQSETPSQFYVDPSTVNQPAHSQTEVGIQADVPMPQSNMPTASVTKTENADNNRHSTTGGSLGGSEQKDSSCVECKPKETTENMDVLNGQVDSQDIPLSKPRMDEQAGLNEAMGNENGDITQQEMTEAGKESEPSFDPKAPSDSLEASGRDQVDTLIQTTETLSLDKPKPETDALDKEEKVTGAKKEKGIHELEALLKSISERRFSDCDDDLSIEGDSISIGSDDESETTEGGKSAFEQLQELLKG